MRDKEQLLMSYLIDQHNLRRHLAQLSPKEASLYEDDLLNLSASLDLVQTQLTELLISVQEMRQDGSTSEDTSE